MTFDATTPAGIRALERLGTEKIGWLTTVTPDGQPQSSAIWFLWEDGEVLIYSHKRALRNGNIEDNPKVAFNLHTDAGGDDYVSMEGTARFAPEHPPSSEVPGLPGQVPVDDRGLRLDPAVVRRGVPGRAPDHADALAARLTPSCTGAAAHRADQRGPGGRGSGRGDRCPDGRQPPRAAHRAAAVRDPARAAVRRLGAGARGPRRRWTSWTCTPIPCCGAATWPCAGRRAMSTSRGSSRATSRSRSWPPARTRRTTSTSRPTTVAATTSRCWPSPAAGRRRRWRSRLARALFLAGSGARPRGTGRRPVPDHPHGRGPRRLPLVARARSRADGDRAGHRGRPRPRRRPGQRRRSCSMPASG